MLLLARPRQFGDSLGTSQSQHWLCHHRPPQRLTPRRRLSRHQLSRHQLSLSPSPLDAETNEARPHDARVRGQVCSQLLWVSGGCAAKITAPGTGALWKVGYLFGRDATKRSGLHVARGQSTPQPCRSELPSCVRTPCSRM